MTRKKTTLAVSEPTEIEVLGWLPQVGEWYSVTEDSRLYVFDSHLKALQHFAKHNNATEMTILEQKKWIFITKITWMAQQPALIDFMVKQEIPQKIYTLPIFPPSNVNLPRMWETFLKKVSP